MADVDVLVLVQLGICSVLLVARVCTSSKKEDQTSRTKLDGFHEEKGKDLKQKSLYCDVE